MDARLPRPGVSHRITRSADMVARDADVCLAGTHVILAGEMDQNVCGE